MKSCANCQWWGRHQQFLKDAPQLVTGWCHYNPPSVGPSAFPETMAGHWCREFSALREDPDGH